MKFNILNFKEMEDFNKNIIITGIYFFMLSMFIVIIMFNYNFIFENIIITMLIYSLYFILNLLGFAVIVLQLNKTISKYKEQIIGLNAINMIKDSDKQYLFKKVGELEKNNKDTIFIKHIQNHLKNNEQVVCKICNKTALQIINEEKLK